MQQISGRQVVRYLDRYLTHIHARTVVVEAEYNDADYLDDFASYYVRCFPDYPRFCRRLHFFNSRFNEKHLEEAILSNDSSKLIKVLQRSYLGFVVARPLPVTVVGRTLLANYPHDNNRRHFPAGGSYKVSLFGIPLAIESIPYQEQDSIVAACATVAIWSVLHRASDLFGTPAPRPMRITSSANKIASQSGRSVPSRGLTLEQMCQAVSEVGLEPEVYRIAPTTPVLSIAYAHLELGLPVIMGAKIEGLEGHAIAITGASVIKSPMVGGESYATDLPLIGRRIDELFAHDDGVGPFAWIRVRSASLWQPDGVRETFPISFLSSWKGTNGQDLLLFPEVLVIPAHPKMRIRYIDIEPTIRDLSILVVNTIRPGIDFEWEPRLKFVNAYKSELRERLSLSAREKDFLFNSQPRFIWCLTLRIMNIEVADVIFDATDLPTKPMRSVLWRDPTFEAAFKARLTQPLTEAQIVASRGRAFFDAIVT